MRGETTRVAFRKQDYPVYDELTLIEEQLSGLVET